MTGYEAFWVGFEWWWIFPVAMIVLCFFMMRGRASCMMGWPSSRNAAGPRVITSSDSAREILDKRYAIGEISKEEYEDKKEDIEKTNG